MFIPYFTCVVLLSLALYGGYLLLRDTWTAILGPRSFNLASVSFLIVIKTRQEQLEGGLRYLLQKIEGSKVSFDVIVADCSNDYMTAAILDRLAAEYESLRVIDLSHSAQPAADVLPLCRGTVIHVLDLGGRLNGEEFVAAIYTLVSRDEQDVVMPEKS